MTLPPLRYPFGNGSIGRLRMCEERDLSPRGDSAQQGPYGSVASEYLYPSTNSTCFWSTPLVRWSVLNKLVCAGVPKNFGTVLYTFATENNIRVFKSENFSQYPIWVGEGIYVNLTEMKRSESECSEANSGKRKNDRKQN